MTARFPGPPVSIGFVDALGPTPRNDLSWPIFDHFPLWVEFAIPVG